MAQAVIRKAVFVKVWAVLICLTVITAVVSEIDLGPWNTPVAMAIASTKVILVALFFMHLRYERSKIIRVWVIAGLFWLSILFLLSMSDYATRGFLRVPGR
jgi:cytochrome c oxidase subunit 4